MSKRWAIRVRFERNVIVYNDDPELAKGLAITLIKENNELDKSEVLECKELPAIENEARGPAIDKAPSRETRK